MMILCTKITILSMDAIGTRREGVKHLNFFRTCSLIRQTLWKLKWENLDKIRRVTSQELILLWGFIKESEFEGNSLWNATYFLWIRYFSLRICIYSPKVTFFRYVGLCPWSESEFMVEKQCQPGTKPGTVVCRER